RERLVADLPEDLEGRGEDDLVAGLVAVTPASCRGDRAHRARPAAASTSRRPSASAKVSEASPSSGPSTGSRASPARAGRHAHATPAASSTTPAAMSSAPVKASTNCAWARVVGAWAETDGRDMAGWSGAPTGAWGR